MSPSETLNEGPRYPESSHTVGGESVSLATAAFGNGGLASHDQATQRLGNGAPTGSVLLQNWSPEPSVTVAQTHPLHIVAPDTEPHRRTRAAIPLLPLSQKNLNALNSRSARTTGHDINHGLKLVGPGPATGDLPIIPAPETAPVLPAVAARGTGVPLAAVRSTAPCSRCSRLPPRRQRQQQTHRGVAPGGPGDQGVAERQRGAKEENRTVLWAADVAQHKAEADSILVGQHKGHIARQRLDLQLSGRPLPPLPSPSSSPSQKTRSPVLEKISRFAKGRLGRDAALSAPSTTSLSSPAPSISPTSSTGTSLDLRSLSRPEPAQMSRNCIEAGGRGQTDAPRGASNGVDRRVTVRCRGATLDVVVGVETSTADLLVACSKLAAQPINVNTSILSEVYTPLGLERRLRRYERVRDVLNSWDHDTQNTLVVAPDMPRSDDDLELGSVPQVDMPPSGFIRPLYYSHKPGGKWSKRFITLLQNGQLVLSKSFEPGPSDRDVLSLCHLSDFDIYTPTESQKRKHLKPPKKYCYAIKSQQKSTVFLNTDNYVHFFCTEDPKAAQEFYTRVHFWRSWYIANRALQLHSKKKVAQEEEKPPQILPDKPSPPKKSIKNVRVHGHKVKVSVDESPYAIGAFKPLINLERFEKPLEEFGNDWVLDSRNRAPQPPASSSSRTEKTTEIKKDALIDKIDGGAGAFAEGGLLGAAYEKRKHAQREQNLHSQMPENQSPSPFAEVRSSLNGRRPPGTSFTASGSQISSSRAAGSQQPVSSPSPSKSEPSGWFPSALEHSAKSRSAAPRPSISSGSTSDQQTHSSGHSSNNKRRPPAMPSQPLVDLAPTFVEPPQWSRHNTGRGYRPPEGKPLVDFATGPQSMPGARRYEPPPSSLIRRGNPGNLQSNGDGSIRGGERAAIGRRPTVSSRGSGGPPISGRSMPRYDQSQGYADNRNRSHTTSSGPPLGAGGAPFRSPPVSVAGSEGVSRGARTGRERSGTMRN